MWEVSAWKIVSWELYLGKIPNTFLIASDEDKFFFLGGGLTIRDALKVFLKTPTKSQEEGKILFFLICPKMFLCNSCYDKGVPL